MAWSIRLAEQALSDYDQILLWTAETFGPRQADVYAETLMLAIEALQEGPDIAGVKRRDELEPPGICTLHVAGRGAGVAILWCFLLKVSNALWFCACYMTAWNWRGMCCTNIHTLPSHDSR